jgi:hypothetical protein
MTIYCGICDKKQEIILTTGKEIYPHRKDLFKLKFWKCPVCGGYVGTHKNSKKHKPLGCIVSKEVKNARIRIHKLLDILWSSPCEFNYSRKELYKKISEHIGRKYHTAKIKTLKEANEIYIFIRDLAKRINND